MILITVDLITRYTGDQYSNLKYLGDIETNMM